MTHETAEVSNHLAKVFLVLKASPKEWLTAGGIAEKADVAGRTARSHCLRLVNLGIVDQAEVFPAHRYRLSPMASKRNKTMVARIEDAAKVFGLV